MCDFCFVHTAWATKNDQTDFRLFVNNLLNKYGLHTPNTATSQQKVTIRDKPSKYGIRPEKEEEKKLAMRPSRVVVYHPLFSVFF